MSAFVDASLVRLSTNEGLQDFIAPADDTGQQRLRTLFAQVYDLPFADVHSLRADVTGIGCQRPLFLSERRTGSWLQSLPAQHSGDFKLEGNDLRQPQWIDVVAELLVTAELMVDGGELASVRMADLGDFDTLEEFRTLVPDLDVDAFLAEHGISTVEELRLRFRFSDAALRFAPAPPADPANLTSQQFPLTLALLIRDTVDLAAVLRDVQLARLAAEQAGGHPAQPLAERRSANAHAVVFPAAAANGLNQEQIKDFLASQHVLASFEQE
jgi:hypothetical protein